MSAPRGVGEQRRVGEHRIVTALFADISGFTSLSEQLDTDELHAIISPLIARMASIGERYGGFVAKYAGDALLVFFGAPVAYEDHAVRALLAAGELHTELARSREELGPAAAGLELHVGVNTGSVVAGLFGDETRPDYSILGDAVNLAQRLEAAAPSGETYVGETTWKETAERFDLEPLGELTVKGKRDPVPAWRLIGELGSPSAERSPIPLVGREEEVRTLRRLVVSAAAGTGALVAIQGHPGIGKSRLVNLVGGEAEAAGLRWLATRCVSYGAAVAYFPLIELLRSSIGIRLEDAPDDAARRLAEDPDVGAVAGAAACFAHVLGLPRPPGSPDVAAGDPEEFRRRLHTAVIGWLEQVSTRGPLMVVVEDLHWVDHATQALLEEAAEATRRAPICLVVAARDDGADAVQALAARAGIDRACVIELVPLDAKATGALAARVLGGRLAPGLVGPVFDRTAGNPFFVRELLRALQDASAVVLGAEGWALAPGSDLSAVPGTVERVLAARIDRLPVPALRLLEAASVIGRRVPLVLLREVATGVIDVRGALRRLVDAGLLEPAGGVGDDEAYLFHHALVLDVVYGRMLRRDRRELHRRVAQAAEELWGSGDDVLDRLAHHLYLAEAGVKAVEVLTRAGARSRRLFANDEAIVHLSRAADLSGRNPRTEGRLPSILVELADVEELVGRYQDAEQHFAAVRERTGDPRAWRGLAAVLRKRGECDAALALIDAAFEGGVAEDEAAGLWLERAWALMAEGQLAAAADAARSGMLLASPRSPERGHLLVQLTQAVGSLGELEAALVHGEEAQALFFEIDDVRGGVTAARATGPILMRLGRLDDAAAVMRRALQLAERIGSVDEIAGCLVNLGLLEMLRGDLDAAAACDRRAVEELRRVGNATGLAIATVNLADKLAQRGDLEEAAERCAAGMALAEANGDAITVAEAVDTSAAIALRRGRFAEAVAHAERAVELFAALGAAEQTARARSLAEEARAKLQPAR